MRFRSPSAQQRPALLLHEELAENRLMANDDRDAVEQAAAIITGKWSDREA
jgi:hypothetical protein